MIIKSYLYLLIYVFFLLNYIGNMLHVYCLRIPCEPEIWHQHRTFSWNFRTNFRSSTASRVPDSSTSTSAEADGAGGWVFSMGKTLGKSEKTWETRGEIGKIGGTLWENNGKIMENHSKIGQTLDSHETMGAFGRISSLLKTYRIIEFFLHFMHS